MCMILWDSGRLHWERCLNRPLFRNIAAVELLHHMKWRLSSLKLTRKRPPTSPGCNSDPVQAMALKELGNEKFKAGEFREAETLYTQAYDRSTRKAECRWHVLQNTTELFGPQAVLKPSPDKNQARRMAGRGNRQPQSHRALRPQEQGGDEVVLLSRPSPS